MIEDKREQDNVQSDKYICFTKVWGVTYDERQEIVRKCQQGQELELEITASPDITFGVDRAVAVYQSFDGQKELKSRMKLGFLHRELAEKLIPNMQHGKKYQCFVEKVTGGSDDKIYFGLNIKIIGEPIEEYEDISDLSDGAQRIISKIQKTREFIEKHPDIPDIPNEIQQLMVLKDGRYQKMFRYEYYEYLESVLGSRDAPIYIIQGSDGLLAASEEEYAAYRRNLMEDYDCDYNDCDDNYGDYYGGEDEW